MKKMATVPHVSRETPGTSAEHRVTLLQSEIKVRDQIANFKQRLDMAFVRLEQQALSDLRALTGQEMLAIRKREDRMMSQDKDTIDKRPAKVFAFYPNRIIESLENELTELGSIRLEDETEEHSSGVTGADNSMPGDTDTLISSAPSHMASAGDTSSLTTAGSSVSRATPSSAKRAETLVSGNTESLTSSTISDLKSGDTSSQTTTKSGVSRATSGYVHVRQTIGHSGGSLGISSRSAYCFVETGTLSKRSKHRRSILDKVDGCKLQAENRQESTSPRSTSVKLEHAKSTETAKEQKGSDVMFTVLKDNKIVTVSKSVGDVTLYSPDFVVLSTRSTRISEPVAICYHVAYDIIALVSRTTDNDKVELLQSRNDELVDVDELTIKCTGQVNCMAYSSAKLYLGCSGNHVHVFDEQWKETPILPHAQLGQKLISIAYNESVFCLVTSDGSVTYVDSLGRHLSKDSVNALRVTYIRGTPFVLCKDKGIKIVETSPWEEEVETENVVIKTGLSEVLDMHVSVDDEVAILFWNEGNLDIRKYKLYQ